MALTEVSRLLKESMVLHKQAKQQSAGKGELRRLVKAKDAEKYRAAYELRKQAIEMDPERDDDAWAEEQTNTAVGRDTHLLLMAFYKDQGLDG